MLIQLLALNGLLSLQNELEPFDLPPLNVFFGPTGSGKSNVVEAIKLLRTNPSNFAAPIREPV